MMRHSFGILFLTLIALGLIDLTPAQVPTLQDIRGTLQSLVYSYSQLDEKLERHENRERSFSEILKRAMQALQRGQKNLEPINGLFTRLDERVSQIESFLISKEEKYNIQTEKLSEALEHMFKWMRENDECFRRPPAAAVAAPPATTAVAAITPDFIKQQEQTNKEVLEQLKKLSNTVDKLLDTSKNVMQQTEVTFKSVPSTAEMLSKIEDRLVSYSVVTPAAVIEQVNNAEFENKVLGKFDQLATSLANLQALPKPKEGLTIADREFIQELNNDTLNALVNLKVDTLSVADKSLAKTTARIAETEQNIENNVNKVFDSVSDVGEVLDRFYGEMNASYDKFNNGLAIFEKFNNILMTNSEYVLDTQRKVEFGTLQIVQKIGDLLDKQSSDVISLVKERISNVNESLIANQVIAMGNISNILESELALIWQQMSNLKDEVVDSKELLTILQGRNDVFVNSTLAGMDGMGNKVESIKGRMYDMDSNLNFLLGRLSLLKQEFDNIKLGLADSLNQLRSTFQNMQDKMPLQGPGPHNIAKNAYDTEVNLLQKRQTSD